jgi:hypothetical protein
MLLSAISEDLNSFEREFLPENVSRKFLRNIGT